MTAPRYQEVKAGEVPEITDDDGTHVRVVCGNFWGKTGPVDGVAADPIYLDVSVSPGKRKTLPVEMTRHAFAYVFAGSGKFCNASGPLAVPTEAIKWLDIERRMNAPFVVPTNKRKSPFLTCACRTLCKTVVLGGLRSVPGSVAT